ncbi:MAG: hypothetical protein HQK55_04150 [Deltaproteobacteria bacterium]|nr:hypothetical protein [Deltaproteobacteria bacterium]
MTSLEQELIQDRNLTFVPMLHGRLEFAAVARRIFHHLKPDAIAVELPPTLTKAVEKGLDRLPYLSVVLYPEKDGRFVYLPIEPQDAIFTTAHLARTKGIPLFFIDRDTEGYPRHREAMPDPYSVYRLGLKAYAEAYLREFEGSASLPEDHLRERTMAAHLQELSRKYERVLCVLGLTHYPEVLRLLDQPQVMPLGRVRRREVTLAKLAAESTREIMSEMPFVAAAFVRTGENTEKVIVEIPDRLKIHQDLIDQSKARHLKSSKEEITPIQIMVLNKFARNYAFTQGYLTPDLYQLLVAARGVAGDNFAYEVWDLATEYPWAASDDQLPTVTLKGEDLYLNMKKISFYRRFRQIRRRLVSVPLRKRPKEKTPGEWRKAWQGKNICSYQPEDLIVEGFGGYLKKKAVQILAEENRRTQPFRTSMLDGLDMRETIRNWHERKIYVTENRPVRGKVGSIVLIFDSDLPEGDGLEKYPWCMTWLGEHEQESDMAFYATPADGRMVGPGISRCEYGGFMLTYPPLRLVDIWKDPFFDGARTKPERLLLAGIDYSEEKLIAYIAPRPPADRVKALAGFYGKKVIYIPIGQFSPVTLKKIRSFHVLDGHMVRAWAGTYIF